jgi:uncharacterized protein YcbX
LVTPTLSNGTISLSAPNHEAIHFAIQTSGTPWPVNTWKSKGVQAIDQGEEAAQWFSDWLDTSVRLVHIADGFKRKLNPDYAINADDYTLPARVSIRGFEHCLDWDCCVYTGQEVFKVKSFSCFHEEIF